MKNDTDRKGRARSLFFFLAAVLVAYLLLAGYVSKALSQSDLKAIQALQVDASCHDLSSFSEEVRCVRAVQASIKRLVPDMNCAENGETIEPLEFIQRQYGCCFDRARFTEKALAHYGFTTRHVAIFDMSDHGVLTLFSPGVASHATSEVYTRKGWMGVDSNEPFILITVTGQVLNYKDFKQHSDALEYPVAPANFYRNKLLVVYGLFSRHGMFHGPKLPAPEFNFRELLYNVQSREG